MVFSRLNETYKEISLKEEAKAKRRNRRRRRKKGRSEKDRVKHHEILTTKTNSWRTLPDLT